MRSLTCTTQSNCNSTARMIHWSLISNAKSSQMRGSFQDETWFIKSRKTVWFTVLVTSHCFLFWRRRVGKWTAEADIREAEFSAVCEVRKGRILIYLRLWFLAVCETRKGRILTCPRPWFLAVCEACKGRILTCPRPWFLAVCETRKGRILPCPRLWFLAVCEACKGRTYPDLPQAFICLRSVLLESSPGWGVGFLRAPPSWQTLSSWQAYSQRKSSGRLLLYCTTWHVEANFYFYSYLHYQFFFFFKAKTHTCT